MRVSGQWIAILASVATGAAVLAVGPMAVPAAAATPAATFGTHTDFATGANPVSVAVGDLNGDSVLDIATANLLFDSVSVLLGDGSGGFGAKTEYVTSTDPYEVAMGDLNGDTFLDLAVANSAGSGGVSVRLGDGTGAFGAKTDYANGIAVYPFAVAISDLDGDGPLDLVLTDGSSEEVVVLLGDGSGAFGPVAHFAAGGGPISVAVGQLDGDTVPDVAVANYTVPGSVSVLLGDGAGGFGPPTAFPAGPLPATVAIGDVNGDGAADLATANSGGATANGTVSVLLGDGTGSFAAPTNVTVGPQPSGVALADLNGDSFVDVAAANRNGALVGDANGSVSVALGNGDGTFDASVSQPTGLRSYSASVVVGDLDGDARPDLAAAAYPGSIAVLRNTTGTVSIAATPSTHLVDGQTIGVTGSGWQPGHTIGFCQAVAVDPPGAANCAEGNYTGAVADAFGNFSGSLVVEASIYVPSLGQQVACTPPGGACVLGVADGADVAGTVTTVPLGFDLAAPTAPTIGAAVAGDGEATVSWSAPAFDGGSPITGYVVTPYIGFAPQPSQAFTSTATSQVVTGLANFTEYRFRVRAVSAVGTGAFSTASNAVYPAPTGMTLPGAPTIGAAVAGPGEANVSWTAPAFDGGSPITGYIVTAYDGYAPVAARVFASTATTQVVTGLTNGTTYRFRVQAVNVVGPGGYSLASNAVTPAAVPDPPVIGSAVPGNTQATVSWTAPASDGGATITGYVVTPHIGAVAQTPIAVGATPTSQTITGLTNGTTYTFTVAATNAVGTGAASVVSNPVTPTATVPGAPTIIRNATAGDGEATVSWTAPVSDGGSPIIGYVVTPYVGYSPRPATTFSSTATTQTITGLVNGTQYRFRVRAINAIGTSGYSTVTNPVTPTA